MTEKTCPMCGYRQVVMGDMLPGLEYVLDVLMDAHFDAHAEDFRIELELRNI